MPWSIRTDDARCRGGYSVVKNETGEMVGCHTSRPAAEAHILAMTIAEQEEQAAPVAPIENAPATEFLDADDFAVTAVGQPYRLLPFGPLVKGGKVRQITKELAARFRLPHFKPPIKAGSHDDATPAVGFITALEVRDDGLYAVPEYTERGQKVMTEGDYRYHSPEIIWAGGLEDPATGELIAGPLIVGDALLHTPHLGEAAALFSTFEQEEIMTENVTMPAGIFARLVDLFSTKPAAEPEQPPPAPVPAAEFDQFAAIQAERDDLAAQVATMKAAVERQTRLTALAGELTGTPWGDDAELLTALVDSGNERVNGVVIRKLRAVAEQARVANLTAPVGNPGPTDAQGDAINRFNSAIVAAQKMHGLDYGAAAQKVANEQPELFAAYTLEVKS